VGAVSPFNAMSLGPRPTSVQSGILVHPAVWSQYGPKSAGGAAVPLSETELPPGEGSSVPI